MEKTEIQKKSKTLSGKFGRFKCEKFAKALMKWLIDEGVEGGYLTLKTASSSRGFIVVDGEKDAISETGKHYGVEVDGIVYDNVFPKGFPRNKWLKTYSADVPLKLSQTSF